MLIQGAKTMGSFLPLIAYYLDSIRQIEITGFWISDKLQLPEKTIG